MGKGKTGQGKNTDRLPFYERPAMEFLCKATGLLAGAMLVAAPFFRWRALHVKANVRVSEGFSLFNVVKTVFSKDFAGQTGQRMAVSLLLMLYAAMAFWVLYFAFRDQICPERLRMSPGLGERLFRRFRLISHILPVVLSILAVILLEHTQAYALLKERLETAYVAWKGLMIKGYHNWKLPGLGFWFFCLGLGLYIFAECFRYLIETLKEEDD